MKDILCGIDLGTTNSCISYLKDGKPLPVELEEGSAIIPSVVSLDESTGEMLVGRRAKHRLAAYPDHTARSIKRLMGRDTAVRLGSRDYSPQELSSYIVKYLVDGAAKCLGMTIKDVVITVPAYFNDAQRRATIQAGEMAGVKVSRIINEPTSASLVYDHLEEEGQSGSPYVLVYDLGGGTFDVSILEIKGEIKEVLASSGDTALGGDDFDERLAEFFMRRLKEQTGHDLEDQGRAFRIRLRELSEKLKIQLSDSPFVQANEIAIAVINGEPVNLAMEVSRKEYEELINDLVKRTIEKTEEALREAHVSAEDIGRVILVGGATRTPLVQEALADMFGKPMFYSVDPDLCVAMGAAVQSGLMAGEPLGHILLDVTSHSLGVKTVDEIDPETGEADYFSVIIRRNSRIPVRRAEAYYTMLDNQRRVEVQVYQGESSSCRDNTLVGEFYFDLKPATEGSVVTAEFAYDKEGIVHITLDQKGFNNIKEATLDVRRKQVIDRQSEEEKKVLNYIVEKARRLGAEDKFPADLKREMTELTDKYEAALKDEDDILIDELEDRLLEIMEEAEERLQEGE